VESPSDLSPERQKRDIDTKTSPVDKGERYCINFLYHLFETLVSTNSHSPVLRHWCLPTLCSVLCHWLLGMLAFYQMYAYILKVHCSISMEASASLLILSALLQLLWRDLIPSSTTCTLLTIVCIPISSFPDAPPVTSYYNDG